MNSTALDRFTGSDDEFLEGNEAPAPKLCLFCEDTGKLWEPIRITSEGKTVYDWYRCGACDGASQIEQDPGDTAVILPDHDDYADRQA